MSVLTLRHLIIRPHQKKLYTSRTHFNHSSTQIPSYTTHRESIHIPSFFHYLLAIVAQQIFQSPNKMFETSNRRQFQKGLDTEKARASRHNTTLSLRRKQRQNYFQKKARLLTNNKNSYGNNDNEPMPSKSLIPKYIANVMQTDNSELQLFGLRSIRKLVSCERNPPTLKIAKCGIVPRIIQFMYGNLSESISEQSCLESAWIVTNIASSTSPETALVVQHNAINAFVYLLRRVTEKDALLKERQNREIVTQAIWGLGNISGDGKKMSLHVIDSGVMRDIVTLLSVTDDCKLQSNAIWALSNLIRYKNERQIISAVSQSNLIEILSKIIRETNNLSLVSDILWTFNSLSLDDRVLDELVSNHRCGNIVMKLLNNEIGKYSIALNQCNFDCKKAMLQLRDDIYRPCLKIIGNILSGTDSLTQCILDCGYLDIIEPFCTHFCQSIRRETMWALSNVCAGSHQQIECVLSRQNLMKCVMSCAEHDLFVVRLEAVVCICNASFEATIEQIKTLANEYGAIQVLCSVLNPIHKISQPILHLILESLESFLQIYGESVNPFAITIEECKGLDFLEQRQCDSKLCNETWQIIADLMNKYWHCDELEGFDQKTQTQQSNIATVIDHNTNQFKFGTINQNENNNSINNHQRPQQQSQSRSFNF